MMGMSKKAAVLASVEASHSVSLSASNSRFAVCS